MLSEGKDKFKTEVKLQSVLVASVGKDEDRDAESVRIFLVDLSVPQLLFSSSHLQASFAL